MLEKQKALIAYCGALTEKIQPAGLSGNMVETIAQLERSVRNQELLVPVVGAFSSGKSTLINKILNEDRLPVAITPETSLATELRYAVEERIEAVREDGGIARFGVDEIETVAQNAAQYHYARLYLNNTRLQDIEPLVLVDMPGFNSPLDAHNKAIMAYIERGCHYLVLVSAEEGTVSSSLLRHVREIAEFSHGMSFFLTKSDLRSQDDVAELARHFTETLRDNGDFAGEVVPISQASPDAAISLLKSINAESLFFDIFRNPAQEVADGLIDAINIHIHALKKDRKIVSRAIDGLKDALDKLQRCAKDELENLSRRNSGDTVIKDVLSDVGEALEDALDELIASARRKNMAATECCLSDIVRSALNISVSRHLGDVNREIVSDLSGSLKSLDRVSGSLKSLDRVMSDLGVSSEFIQKLAGIIESQISDRLAFSVAETAVKTLLPATAKVAGIGAATIANPVLGIVVAFLPEILGGIFGKINESQMDEKLRVAFLGEVFPQIKRQIRPELQRLFNDATRSMIEKARAQYEEQIGQKRAELEAALREKGSNTAERDRDIERLEKVRDAVNAAVNELFGEIA
ncbi:MAG: dynamin family protein [Azoarcus sp.]|jgi:GTPase SAR1 family protein|nr:dynamin family protein [Azoarcus sp.]